MQSQKMHRRQRRKTLVPLEPLMQGVQAALVHDLSDHNLDRICSHYERGEAIPTQMGWPPYMFKRLAQLRSFDKRIIWSKDKSFDTLSEEALASFAESQKTFCLPEPMSRRASLVIHHAANICHLILGKFSYEEWFDSCSFGKRAAYGLPRSKAYLDERIARSNGTLEQEAAYNACLTCDVHLLRAMRSVKRRGKTVEQIKATAVPKSFKSARIIAPDTILGGFLSRGLGELIRAKLEKETHIDLSKQQERHRRWAQRASKNGYLSTIDMSKASDSFVWRHVECIVPKDWHSALQCVRVPRVLVGKDQVNLSSFMLMGSGHTFPLQTLLFYALAEATRTLLCCRGKVSVYGDDIIVPTRMSRHFIVVMSELGFIINSEKSFYDEPDPDTPSHSFFRESCGGDYKGGIDVRPYMPECDLQSNGTVPGNVYLAWCHKMINGLLERWSPWEIPVTLGYLLREINNRKRKICFVPSWETDHSGIKHYIPPHLTFGLDCSNISYEQSYPVYWKLTFRRKKRKRRTRERAYIWYAYWLKRKSNSLKQLPPLWTLLHEEEKRREAIRSYDPPVSLNGEPKRDQDGYYRWTKQGPKVI